MGKRTSRRQGQEEQSFRPRYYRADRGTTAPRYYRAGHGTTAPRYYRAYYRTYYRGNRGFTVVVTVLPQLLPRGNRRNTIVVTVVAAVLPHPRYYRANHGTTVLPAHRFGPTAPVSESGPP